MNSRSMLHSCRVLATLALLGSVAARAVELPLGISAQKPADGASVAVDGGYMVAYDQPIPGTEVVIRMTPVPGGEFLLGSPEGEPGRSEDEGPQRRIVVPPFWIATHETCWAQYRPYMEMCAIFEKFNDRGIRAVTEENRVDSVTAPSKLYDPQFTFSAGEDPQLPAVSMSQYAAKQYSKWLSLQCGNFYRLPTEAEWEYACRADSEAAYSFGDDPAQLGDHAWYAANSDESTHLVGEKQPNAWGLFDMHGNASEWVLDSYDEAGYPAVDDGATSAEALRWPTKVFPRVLRGGSALFDPELCRSAARRASNDPEFKSYDPNTPTSPWWLASDEAQDVGFRLIRPLVAPERADRTRYWDADVVTIDRIATLRIEQEGKGERGLVDPDLPAAIESLKSESQP